MRPFLLWIIKHPVITIVLLDTGPLIGEIPEDKETLENLHKIAMHNINLQLRQI